MTGAKKVKALQLWVREDLVKKLIQDASKRGVLLTHLLREGLSDILFNEEIYKRPYHATKLEIPTAITEIFDAMHIDDSKIRCAITHIAIEKLVYRLQYAPESIRAAGDSNRVVKGVDGLGSLLKAKRPMRRIRTWRGARRSDIIAEQQTTTEDDK